MLKTLVIIAMALLPAQTVFAHWTRSWSAAPLQFPIAPPPGPAGAAPQPLVTGSDQTFRMVVMLSSGGSRLRLRLSNELGADAAAFDDVELGLAGRNGAVVPGTIRRVTFGGMAHGLIPAWSPIESDPIPLEAGSGARLIVSVHVPANAAMLAMHPLAGAKTQVVPGRRGSLSSPEPAGDTLAGRVLLSGIDVDGPAKATIVVIGDSITDGREDSRWPDVLVARLNGRVAVANAGISGNRLLSMGTGQPALARLDRDALSVPGIRYLVVALGINDIGGSVRDKLPMPPPATIIAAYRQMISRARVRGITVIGATLLPYRDAFFYSPEGDAVRHAVNAWIRTGGEFDGFIDFEAALADPARPDRLSPGFDSGDHLHPNAAGLQRMGSLIDLKLFR